MKTGRNTAANSRFEIRELSCGYGERLVVEGFSLELWAGEILCILGRNGIGKTTLFKTLLGTLPSLGGEVRIDGRDLFSMTRKAKAALIAYVPQIHDPIFGYTAYTVVLMGRAGLMNTFSQPAEQDKRLALDAMAALGIEHLKDRPYTKVSGGERQMVLIARALAQGADFLFLDEPASGLDYGNQMRVLSVLKELADAGKGIVFTSHDPSHAFLLDSKLAAIQSSRDFCIGSAEDVVTAELAAELYGVRAEIVEVFDEVRGENVKVFAPFLEQ